MCVAGVLASSTQGSYEQSGTVSTFLLCTPCMPRDAGVVGSYIPPPSVFGPGLQGAVWDHLCLVAQAQPGSAVAWKPRRLCMLQRGTSRRVISTQMFGVLKARQLLQQGQCWLAVPDHRDGLTMGLKATVHPTASVSAHRRGKKLFLFLQSTVLLQKVSKHQCGSGPVESAGIQIKQDRF